MFWFNIATAVLGSAIIGLAVCGFLVSFPKETKSKKTNKDKF